MKWLKSTTDKTYTACGKTIPSSTSEPLCVTDDVCVKITSMPVIKSLITTGGILVLSSYTSATQSADAQVLKLQALNTENTRLATRIRMLEQELESSKTASTRAANSKAVKEAQAEAAEASERAGKLQEQLEELQAQYDALKAEAEAKIAELTKDA